LISSTKVLCIFRGLGAFAAAIVLSGCFTPIDHSNYRRVGSVSWTDHKFVSSPDYEIPADFKISPEKVFSTYGDLCKGHYNCTYFADNNAYYLLPDYGVVPSISIARHAVAIVDGRSGGLLKAP
jgi:hypothetical protein